MKKMKGHSIKVIQAGVYNILRGKGFSNVVPMRLEIPDDMSIAEFLTTPSSHRRYKVPNDTL